MSEFRPRDPVLEEFIDAELEYRQLLEPGSDNRIADMYWDQFLEDKTKYQKMPVKEFDEYANTVAYSFDQFEIELKGMGINIRDTEQAE